ncbi:reverse transcriptase [Plakobranchus ocellatus]|uniref:Reverse transcriptase n=1 Tax=Plakobranchus ocellatus TaxID=259542 RepID=A0AAV3YIW9_9GAST|nr:reverse transcriptase [Plakobranchus ocellatus]
MHSRKAKLKLSLKSIVEEYKCGKARLMTMLEDSEDPAVRSIQPQRRTGGKWNIDKTVDQTKEGLKMKDNWAHSNWKERTWIRRH